MERICLGCGDDMYANRVICEVCWNGDWDMSDYRYCDTCNTRKYYVPVKKPAYICYKCEYGMEVKWCGGEILIV